MRNLTQSCLRSIRLRLIQHKFVINVRVSDTSFLTKNFADFLYNAGKNNQDFVPSLVAF